MLYTMSAAGEVEFAFIAALEREVRGAVRGWTKSTLRVSGRDRRVYRSERQRSVLLCAGTGAQSAYAAAQACIESFSPHVLLSIGFAGSCVAELAPGTVVIPAKVVAPSTGKEFPCAFGIGTLVSLDEVAGLVAKRQARERYGALAVEMEAAGVAAAAAEYGREFAALKVISDGVDEEIDFLSAFVTAEGFAAGRFLAHLVTRPRLWPRVAALKRNSRLASSALEKAVGECCRERRVFAGRHS